jgi:hypothetical protein
MLKSGASFFIWYSNIPCYLFSVSDRDIKQTARRIVGTSYTLLCIRTLLQALHTSSGYLDSCYAHCTDQRNERTLACNKFEVSGRRKVNDVIMIPDNVRMKFRMANLRENWIRIYHNTKQVCLPMDCLYVFWPYNNAACKRGIFSILSLDFLTTFKIVIKTVKIDC